MHKPHDSIFKRTLLSREVRAAFAIALGAATPFSAAQEKADADVASLEAVTVTAQKREEKVQEVPSAITVLGGAQLLDDGVGRSASEVLNYVPNASAGTQQHGRPRWWIRGVGAGQQQIDFPNPVGFYLDDVYISNASATGFPLFDLDRVEVLRGPQGTLWGKNTTGGAINIISRKPAFKTDGYFKADYSSFDTKLVEAAVGGALIKDILAGRIAFHTENQGEGRYDNQFTGKKDGKLRDTALRAQLQALIGDNLSANFSAHYRDYKTTGATTTTASYVPSGVFRNGYIPSTNTEHVSTNAPAWSEIEQSGAQLNLQYQAGKLLLTSITAYEGYKSDSIGDSDNTPLEISRSKANAKSRQYSQELRLASPKTGKISWVTGLHYFKEDIDSDSHTGRLPNGSVPALAGSSQPVGYNRTVFAHNTRSFAVFGSTTVNFTDRLLGTFGLRWTTETKDLDLARVQTASNTAVFANPATWWNGVTGNFAAPSVASNNFTSKPSTTWRAFTWDVTPEYKFSDTLRSYFKYAHGLKSGGYNTSAASVLALNTLAPEKLDAVELGVKSEWLGGRVNANASVFHYDYKNAQVNITGLFNGDPTQSVSYLQNVEKASVDGVELELEAIPFDNFHVNANVGWLSTSFDKFEIQNNGGNRNGNEFVRSPHATALVAADYRIPFGDGSKLVLIGDVRYTSKQFYYVDPQSEARHLLNQKGYSIANVRAAYSLAGGKHTITAYANNVGDTVYKNHTLTSFVPGTVTGDTVIWGQRRTYGLSYLAKF